MAYKKVSVDEIAVEIARVLEIYTQEVNENISEAANIVTKELLSDIREDSPVRTGVYKKGWTRKKLKYSYVVYNKNKPHLTHMLEKGRKNGTMTAQPHILKNTQRATERFEDLCVAIVSEGLRLK